MEEHMPGRRRAAAPVVVEDDIEELEEITEDEDVEELEEVADDDLEELEEEEPEPVPAKRTRAKAATAPAKATKAAPAKATKAAAAAAPKAETSENDSNWLASYVSEETGIEHDGRAIRMLLRKLAKDGVFEREIGTDRGRYVFPKGANDTVVKAVLKMVRSGEATAVKREGLDSVKENAVAKKTAAKAAAPAKAAPAKAAPAKAAPTRRRAAAK
jgi:hypothetical protein